MAETYCLAGALPRGDEALTPRGGRAGKFLAVNVPARLKGNGAAASWPNERTDFAQTLRTGLRRVYHLNHVHIIPSED